MLLQRNVFLMPLMSQNLKKNVLSVLNHMTLKNKKRNRSPEGLGYQFKEQGNEFRFHCNNSPPIFNCYWLFLILSPLFLHDFLSQPQWRKSDCSRMDFVAHCFDSVAQWLTLYAQSLDKISVQSYRIGLAELLPFVHDFSSVKGT